MRERKRKPEPEGLEPFYLGIARSPGTGVEAAGISLTSLVPGLGRRKLGAGCWLTCTKMKGRGKGFRVHHLQGVCRVLPTAPPKTLAPSEAARMFPTHPSSQLPALQMVGRRGRRRRGRGASRAGNSETGRLDGAWVAGRPPGGVGSAHLHGCSLPPPASNLLGLSSSCSAPTSAVQGSMGKMGSCHWSPHCLVPSSDKEIEV